MKGLFFRNFCITRSRASPVTVKGKECASLFTSPCPDFVALLPGMTSEVKSMIEKIENAEKIQPAPPAVRTVRADDIVLEIRRMMGEQEIAAIYEHRILTIRTRRFELNAPAKKVPVEIQHTLLGVELKVGSRRLLCPDFATARYLAVFARLGVEVVAVPYDITQISHLADALETSWYRMIVFAEHLTADRSARLRGLVLAHLIETQRAEIMRLGGGTKIPKFNQNTSQRFRR